jgi:hypothetical protein
MEKVVRIFASHAEADEAEALSDTQLSPDDRIRIAVELRDRRHPDAAQQDLREFVGLLNSNGVDYLVVGVVGQAP